MIARQPWTPHEDDAIRHWDWEKSSVEDLARRLGRSPNAVRIRRYLLGVKPPRATMRLALPELHGLGLSDYRIAERTGTTQAAVTRARNALGLPPNFRPGRPRKAVSA